MSRRRLPDLRTALAGLDSELLRVREEVSARFGVSARYARWAGAPAAPPTGPGPVVLFEHVIAESGVRGPVLMGLYGTRRRAAGLLGLEPAEVPFRLLEAVRKPVPPVVVVAEPERIARPPDLTALPIPVLTDADAGPYLTLGAVLATDPATGVRNLSVHRMCVQGPDTLTIWMVPGRDLERAYNAALARGESLPVAIHLGVAPAVLLSSCCPSSLVPPEIDELAVAGALGGAPVELMACTQVDAECIAHAEYVIEGEILDKKLPENAAGTLATPEFLGYQGRAHRALPVIRVRAITARPGAILQTVSGPGLEQSVLLGYGMEAAVIAFLSDRGAPLASAHCHTAGGGQLMLVLQWRKRSAEDDTEVRSACEAVLQTFRMVKTVLAVDEDVDPESDQDLWWAMVTRLQADRDISILPDLEGFPLDPSQSTAYSPKLSADGRTAKAVFDCTVPFALRDRFTRARFTPEQSLGEQRPTARHPQ